jgi:hypothetical protein
MRLFKQMLFGWPARRRASIQGSSSPCRRFRPFLEALENRRVPSRFEVWAIDQSNTRDENGNGSILDGADSGGTLYIYRGDQLQGQHADSAVPKVIDLGGAARDVSVAQTGTAPIRPHMFFFNSTHSHAIISFVASGHVLFMDAASREPIAVIDVGVQAHAAIPAPDDSYVIVANQNGKMLHRIWTNYATNTFTLDPVPLNLASGTTPSGAPRQDPVLRPDNAPICGIIDPTSRLTFVTLRGGGLFVVDSAGGQRSGLSDSFTRLVPGNVQDHPPGKNMVARCADVRRVPDGRQGEASP